MQVVIPQETLVFRCRDDSLLSLLWRDKNLELNLCNLNAGKNVSVLLSRSERLNIALFLGNNYLAGKQIRNFKALSFKEQDHVLTFKYDNYGDPFEDGVLVSLEQMGKREYEVLESVYCFISRQDIKDFHDAIVK